MALTYEQFMEATGAEIVCGNIVVGEMANRKVVGTHDETFNLNDDGMAIAKEVEEGTYVNPNAPVDAPKTRRKKAEEAAPAVEATAEVKAE
jgi:hypothetical protein